MNQFALRLPESLLKAAKEEHTSLNQLFVTTIAEKLSAIRTEDMLLERAEHADISAAKNVLSKIKSNPLVPGAEI